MKICLIGNYLLTRSAYVSALSQIDGIDSVIDFGSISECWEFLENSITDAVLIDVELTEDEITTIREMKMKFKSIKFIIMAQQNEVLEVLALGATYVLKDLKMEEFVRVIATTLKGNLFIASDIVDLITSVFQDQITRQHNIKSYRLTEREKEILTLVAKGLSNTEIGKELFLSAFTVKNYVSKIIEKMEVKDRTQAVAKAIQCGLV